MPSTEMVNRQCLQQLYIRKLRNRNEFSITETELKLIAAAAIIGDNSIPKTGYKTPAATEIPKTL